MVINPISIHKDAGSIPGPTQWVRIWCCRELWCCLQMRFQSDVWLWHRLAAPAPIRSLAWELPCASGMALGKKKKKTKRKKRNCYIQSELEALDPCNTKDIKLNACKGAYSLAEWVASTKIKNLPKFFLFFFMATPAAFGSSQIRDRI